MIPTLLAIMIPCFRHVEDRGTRTPMKPLGSFTDTPRGMILTSPFLNVTVSLAAMSHIAP
jgi:hypothetical protein